MLHQTAPRCVRQARDWRSYLWLTNASRTAILLGSGHVRPNKEDITLMALDNRIGGVATLVHL